MRRVSRTVPPACGFIDAPIATDLAQLEADIAFLGVPWGIPYRMGQTSSAETPGYLRQVFSRFRRSLVGGYNFDFGGELLAGRTVRVVDCGDVRSDPPDIPATVGRLILNLIHAMVKTGQFD
jgi:agmatinase